MNTVLKSAYEVSRELNVAHTTVYNWISKGLPYHEKKVGLKTIKQFDIQEVKDWIKERG
jgi:hypothetical protein